MNDTEKQLAAIKFRSSNGYYSYTAGEDIAFMLRELVSTTDRLKRANDLIRRVAERHNEYEARDIGRHEFHCVISDCENYIEALRKELTDGR